MDTDLFASVVSDGRKGECAVSTARDPVDDDGWRGVVMSLERERF